MDALIKKIYACSTSNVKLLLIMLSMIVALQVQYIQHGWINSDSILYLEAAKLFTIGEWEHGYAIFPWPFYSLCISATHIITQLSIHHSAQFLNVLFFGITCSSFLKIIELAGGKQLQLIAGGMILLSSQYLIGGVLEMLMRDEGFWAFYLTSLVFFIQFFQRQQFKHAFLWQLSILIATLFRIEAILFLLCLPLMFLFVSGHTILNKLKLLLQTYCLQLAIALCIIILLLSSDSFSTSMLGRLNEIFTTDLLKDFSKQLSEKSQIMSELVLGGYLDEYAIPSLILTFIYIILVKATTATGLINSGLALLGLKNHQILIDGKSYQVLITTAVIAATNMILIITKVFVLSSRYVLSLSFVLMIIASFYFAFLVEQSADKKNVKHQLVVATLALVMSLGFINNLLPKRDGYNYLQEAVSWTRQNNIAKSPTFFSDARMRYYANLPYTQRGDSLQTFEAAVKDGSINQYEFIVVSTSVNDKINAESISKLIPNYTLVKEVNGVRSKKKAFIFNKK
jgi:hypothetical protein